MPRRTTGLAASTSPLRAVLANRALGGLELAWLAVNAGKWALLVANLVVAYDAGGPLAVGILGLARYLTPTIIAPFAGLPTAHWPTDRVLMVANLVRAIAVGLMVLAGVASGSFVLLCVLVALEAGAGAFTRPLHMSLMPAVARTPGELVAANVISGVAEALGTCFGPLVAGLLLASGGPVPVYAAVLLIYLVGVAAIARVRVRGAPGPSHNEQAMANRILAGARTVATLPGPRILITAITLQTVVRGLLTVLTVVAAIELLGMGDPGVGTLNAAMGAGGLIGAFSAIALSGQTRLAPWFTIALAGWGLPIAAIGLLADPLWAAAMMIVIGTSNAILDVAGYTLLQRSTPNDARVAVLGLLDSFANGGVALGGIVAPVLVLWLDIQGALVVAGAILPVVAVVTWPALRRLDHDGVVPDQQLHLIRGVPLFAPLSLAVTEWLASRLTPVTIPAGDWLMQEGQPGDRYYIVETGEVEVTSRGELLRRMGPGAGIGEIALLRSVPRTASVRAATDVVAWTLVRADFLEAVTGQPQSLAAAEAVVDSRLKASLPIVRN